MKCDKCGNTEVKIEFEEWKSVTEVMLMYIQLTKEQKDMILLMVDGALYRAEKSKKLEKAKDEK